MIQPIATPVEVPPDVTAFAAAQGVGEILPAVVEMTQRIFPGTVIRVYLEDDPEIPDDWHIIVEAQAVRLPVEAALAARYQWIDGLFGVCPAPLVCVFRLALDLIA